MLHGRLTPINRMLETQLPPASNTSRRLPLGGCGWTYQHSFKRTHHRVPIPGNLCLRVHLQRHKNVDDFTTIYLLSLYVSFGTLPSKEAS